MSSNTEAISTDKPNPKLVLLTVSLCTMLYSATVTVVNVTLPQLQGALSATPDQIAWVVTLNVVGTAVMTPLSGWLTARLGKRNLILICVIGFAVTSFLCATANSLAPMLLYRVIQGMFGAPIVPVSQAIVLATFTGRRQASAQAFFGMAVVAGLALAPVAGGYAAELYNWRAVFLLLIPICIAALVMTFLFIKPEDKQEETRLDWTGFLSLAVSIACLQLLLDRGESLGWFSSTEIILYAGSLALGLYIFTVHTATAEHSFLNRELLRNRNYIVGLAIVCFYGMLNFTPVTLLPPLLQTWHGYPDSLIGWLLAMRGFGTFVGFFLAARLARFDPRYSMAGGFALIGLSGFMLAVVEPNSRADWIAWAGLIQGLGSGICWVPATTAAFWNVPRRLLPDGAAIFHLLRNLGQSIYLAVAFLVIVRTGQTSYSELTTHINPYNEALAQNLRSPYPSIAFLQQLQTLGTEVSKQANLIAFNNAFLLYGWSCLAAIPIVFLWRKTDRVEA